MGVPMRLGILLWLAAATVLAADRKITAGEIMARVTENQERAVEARKAFVFTQLVRSRVFKDRTKLRHELLRRYLVTPTADGLERELVEESGKQFVHGELAEYGDFGEAEQNWDTDLAEELADNFFDESSRDGMDEDLFPLTSQGLADVDVRLEGVEEYRDREVYKIVFEPREKFAFEGEALIDAEEFQPVLVTSYLSDEIPRWIRWVWGVDVKQLGFKVSYEKFDDGIWFPTSYGGELRIRLFHFYKRTASVAHLLEDFRRTSVSSAVSFGDVPARQH